MVIQHNLIAQNANRQLSVTGTRKSKSTEKLSSGYKVNRAADNAAGLSISEKLRAQIRGLGKASTNAQDGISLIQTAEGALNEVHSILDRMKELSVQASNDTNTETDRNQIQMEINEMVSEVNRVASTTQFNTMNLLDGSLAEKKSGSSGSVSPDALSLGNKTYIFELMGVNGKVENVTSTSGVDSNSFTNNEKELATFAKKAAANAVSKLYENYPSLFNNSATSGVQVGLDLGGIDGQNGTLAYAQLGYSTGSGSSTMQYTMKIDTADYNPASFGSMDSNQRANLAATIAHEMTHVAMYDTLTAGMVSGSGRFPSWFIEGMAQTSSGDNGWVSNQLSSSSSDARIAEYMSNGSVRDYGAGYLASMYLGQLASGSDTVSSANIKSGLNKVLGDLSSGKTLNETIAKYTGYSGVIDFENKVFNSADQATKSFVHNLLTARGQYGGGSLLASDLSTSTGTAFAVPQDADTNYKVDIDYRAMKNVFSDGIDMDFGGSGFNGGFAESRGGLKLQVGALSGQAVSVFIEAMNARAIGIEGLSVLSFESAGAANASIEEAIDKVSTQRAKLGAMQNRLEHTIMNLDNTQENLQAAESRIRDTDMAKEMVQYSMANILEQAGQAMLTQANQSAQSVLSLLQ